MSKIGYSTRPLLDGQDIRRLAIVTMGFLSVLFGMQYLVSLEVPVEPKTSLVGYCDGALLVAQEEDEFPADADCLIIERIEHGNGE